ncbi:MAG: TlpA disulfide reductase family protein, partial [Planctomycetota bacterium]
GLADRPAIAIRRDASTLAAELDRLIADQQETVEDLERRRGSRTDAYDELDAYRAECVYEIAMQNGGWINRRRATIDIAYDPATRRLMIDDPEAYIVVANDTLLARRHDTPTHHVRHTLEADWAWAELVELAPVLSQRPLPDIAWLLEPNPIDALSDGFNERATPLPPEAGDTRPRLQFHTGMGIYTLAVDPQSRLLSAGSLDLAGAIPGQAIAFTYRWTLRADDPPTDDTFAFDTTGSTELTAFDQLSAAGGAGAAPAPPAVRPGPAMDAELTMLDGEPARLSDFEGQTLVLAFVTTWAAGGADVIQAMDEANARAKEGNADAAFVVVDLYEPADIVRPTIEALDIDLPVILDEEGVVAEAVQAFLVPTVVVIRDGQVTHTFKPDDPDLAGRLAALALQHTRPQPAADDDTAPSPEPMSEPNE